MRISNKMIAILGLVIVLLMLTQYLFSPPSVSKYVKYAKPSGKTGEGTGSRGKPFVGLQNAIDRCDDGDTLRLLPGVYEAEPSPFPEELCGNCQNHRTPVNATRGFFIEGKRLTLEGAGAAETTLKTNAGYGVLFYNSYGSALLKLTVSGGVRDPDGNAADGAVVVKYSSVTIENCRLADNTHRIDTVVVGIGGIIGREGASIIARDNVIENNGWDGIALYRGAFALITGNTIKQGRGAGIGVTWDAYAIIVGNRISGYWKGIGSFGDSRVTARNNVVRDCLGWGIIATGTSYLDACNNVVYHNGNCGMAAWSKEAAGRFSNNIVVLNGWKEQWVAPQVGIQNYGGFEKFIISHNCVWNNAAGNYGDMPDLTGKEGNISLDPGFADPSLGDFNLKPGSPCIDAGNPLITDEDGTISDMGLE